MDRFLAKIHKEGGHWLWTGYVLPNGYGGGLRVNGRQEYAHRAAYILFKGPLDPGHNLVIDHLCRVRHCANPDHLELVTHTENLRRGNGSFAVALSNRRRGEAMTTCRQGHEYTAENTKYEPRKGNRRPSRRCVACQKAGYQRRKNGEWGHISHLP